MSGRLDAFFSLTLCHALVACLLFAGALSFYAPLATSYHPLVSLAAFLYWFVVLFILTVLTTTIQLVMRMVRVGSGQLLQRYRRVGVMLANPQPVSQDFRRRRTSQNLSYNNRGTESWSGRLRRLTDLTRPNNNNNNNNNNNDNDNDINDDVSDGIALTSTGTVLPGFNRHGRALRRTSSPLVRRYSYRNNSPTARQGRMTDRFLMFNECSSVFSSLSCEISRLVASLPPPTSSSLSSSSSASCAHSVSDADVDGAPCCISEARRSSCLAAVAERVDAAAELNVNNSNEKSDNTTVSVTVQSSHHAHAENVSSNAGHSDVNYSTNAGAEDVPRVSRRSSGARSSYLDEIVGRHSRSSDTQSIAKPRRSSTGQSISQEPRRSSAAPRQSGVESRRSSAGRSSSRELSIADRRSSTALSPVARRSSAGGQQSGVEPRRSSVGQESRRSSAREQSVAERRSSTGQSLSQEARRSSARMSVMDDDLEPRRSSVGQESRRSSAREQSIAERRSSTGQSLSHEARRSSVMDNDMGPRRSSMGQGARPYSKGLEVSDEAAKRSSVAGASDMAGKHSFDSMSMPAGNRRRSVSSKYCCEPVPVSPCSSCCRPSVRPATCWCRCPSEIHYPELLDDCCGSRDGRLLSLPGFPRNKPSCNSCVTPCRPLPPLCSKTADCGPPKCRFSSRRDCACACPCEEKRDEEECSDDGRKAGKGVVGGLLNKLGFSRSENATPRRSTTSKPSFTSSVKSLFNRRSSAGNTSRNNPALRFDSLRNSPISRPYTGASHFNASANSSSAFDVYWNSFWDQIAPHQHASELPSTFENVSLADLKTFTGQLIETVIAKLKAQYVQPSTKPGIDNHSAYTVTPNCMSEEDIEALCRDILRELMRDDKSTTIKSCDNAPTIIEPSEPCDESAASLRDEDATENEDEDDNEEGDDLRSDLLLDDASLREFAGGVVEGLYTAMRRKLQDVDSRSDAHDNFNCSRVIANADDEIRTHVRSL